MEVPDDACVLKNDTVCDPEDVRHFIRVEPSIHELPDAWIWLKRRGICLRPGMSRDFAAAFSTFIIREIVDPLQVERNIADSFGCAPGGNHLGSQSTRMEGKGGNSELKVGFEPTTCGLRKRYRHKNPQNQDRFAQFSPRSRPRR